MMAAPAVAAHKPEIPCCVSHGVLQLSPPHPLLSTEDWNKQEKSVPLH